MSDLPKPPVMVYWSKPMLRKFKRAFAIAMQEKGREGVFTFEGKEFLVSYSAYLIEYLDAQFGTKSKTKNTKPKGQ